jgi:hypothetical protein
MSQRVTRDFLFLYPDKVIYMINNQSRKKMRLSSEMREQLLVAVDYSVVSEVKMGKDFIYPIDKEASLFSLNKKLVENVLSHIPLNNSCVGFVKGKSYFDFLEPHRYSSLFTRLDVSSFFHSINAIDIAKGIEPYISPKFLDDAKKIKSIDKFLDVVTYPIPKKSNNIKFKGKTILPMGYPSSPVISNILFRKIDIQIQKYCVENRITYTRYADDMLFSSHVNTHIYQAQLIKRISSLIGQLSLQLNETKTIRTTGHISLNGYVIDGEKNVIRISNSKLVTVNKLTHMLLVKNADYKLIANKLYGINLKSIKFKYPHTEAFFTKYCKDQILNKLIGNRSYLISAVKYHDRKGCVCPDFISKLEVILERLNKIIDEWV